MSARVPRSGLDKVQGIFQARGEHRGLWTGTVEAAVLTQWADEQDKKDMEKGPHAA